MATVLKSLLLFAIGILMVLSTNLPIWARTATRLPQSHQVCLVQLQTHPNADPQALAQTFDADAYRYFQQGQTQQALDCWEQASKLYAQTRDEKNLAVSQLNQVQALQGLGFYTRAKELLIELQVSAYFKQKGQKNALFRARVLRSFGDVLRSLGALDCEEELLPPQNSTPNAKQSEVSGEKEKDALKRRCSPQVLEALKSEVEKNPDLAQEQAAVLISLGNTQRAIAKQARERREAGEYKTSEECKKFVQNQSNQKKLDDEWQRSGDALKSYQTAAEIAKPNSSTYIQAGLNQLSVQIERSDISEATRGVVVDLEQQIDQLPGDRTKIYAQLNLAQMLSCVGYPAYQPDTIKLLQEAHNQADRLKDARAQSYALGYLGHLQERTGNSDNWQEALEFTKKALLLAQRNSALDITYLWQWQLGRILAKRADADGRKALNGSKYEEAIAVYEEAIVTLKLLRGDLLAVNQEVQFSFRDGIEPIYRELLALLLPADPNSLSHEALQTNLKRAFYYTESLQIAELENFFQCGLQNAGITKINIATAERNSEEAIAALLKQMDAFLEKEPKAAIVYPVLVQDLEQPEKRLTVIVKLPHKDFEYSSTQANDSVEEDIKNIRDNVKQDQGDQFRTDLKTSLAKLYKWLIEPFNPSFMQAKIQTLVFIPDSSLRSIPMAALIYDNTPNKEHYLVETNYSLALAPSLQLLRSDYSRPVTLKPLIAGIQLTKGDRRTARFQTLNSIEQSKPIEDFLKKSENKSNAFSQFKAISLTRKGFETEIKQPFYNMVHLITHGEFSPQLQTTFVVTDDALEKGNTTQNSFTNESTIDEKVYAALIYRLVLKNASIDINTLTNWIQARNQQGASPIDLFVLSACQTASGSNRVVLGMAGLAVKSGARATVAPLWSVAQESVNQFMPLFYEELAKHPGANRANALKEAQRRLMTISNYKDPYHWAAYVLVGNY